jgi:hypothetical protein
MLSLIFARIFLLCSFHAVHISYGDLSISKDSLKGSLTVYKDDWAKATEHWFRQPMATEPKAIQDWMESEYLKGHVRFWLDGYSTPVHFDLRVKEDAPQSITYEFTAPISSDHRTIIIDSRAVLTEYNDQMNLMTVKVKENTENIIFTSDHTTSTITL